MERLREFTPHLPSTLRYGATSSPLPCEGRGEETAKHASEGTGEERAQQRCLRTSRQSGSPFLLEKREENARQRWSRTSRQPGSPLLLEKRRGEGEEFIAA